MESIPFWLAHYGYASLAVLLALGIIGLPIPDETLLAFAGHLIAKGKLALIPTIGTAFLGSVWGNHYQLRSRSVGRALLYTEIASHLAN